MNGVFLDLDLDSVLVSVPLGSGEKSRVWWLIWHLVRRLVLLEHLV